MDSKEFNYYRIKDIEDLEKRIQELEEEVKNLRFEKLRSEDVFNYL